MGLFMRYMEKSIYGLIMDQRERKLELSSNSRSVSRIGF
jgi:hypothetical protein